MKIARRGRLSPRQTAVLAEVAAWREREARRRDLPPGWLVKDPSIVEIARAQPADSAALRRVRGVGTLGSAEASLLEAVRAGKEAPPIEAAREPAPEIARRDRGDLRPRDRAPARAQRRGGHRQRADRDALRARGVRPRRGARRGARHQLATGWRAELVGEELRQLLDGRIAIAASRTPPYVEIIARD